MNYHKKLYKIGFRKLSKPIFISRKDGEWVEMPIKDGIETEDRIPIINTFKYVIDSKRRLYINIARSGMYQCQIVDDNDKQIRFILYKSFPDSNGLPWFYKFEPNFWEVIISQLDKDMVREIRFKKLFPKSRRGTEI